MNNFSGRKASSESNSPDSLFSTDLVEVVLGISEGPIEGLVDGPKSFFIGDTPLKNSNGTNNFDKYKLIVGEGSDTGETIVSELGGLGSSTDVNTPLVQNIGVVRQGTHTQIGYLDFRLVINRLSKTEDKTTKKAKLEVKIEYKAQSSGTWLPITATVTPSEVFTGSNYVEYQSISDKNLDFIPAEGDRKVYIQSTSPGTPAATDINPVWINSSADYRPRPWNGTTFVLPGDQVKTVGADGSYWTWTENGVPKKLFFPGTSNDYFPTGQVVGNLYVTDRFTGSFICTFWNGSTWVQAEKTIAPVATNLVAAGGIVTINEKVSSPVVYELRVPVPEINVYYDMRVTKLSPESDTDDFYDVVWESFQEINKKSFTWPNTATAHLVARASDQFSSLGELSGIWLGRIVKVPSNYNASTRIYTGVWDGTWQLSYTNNPVWVAQDLIENTRYGINAYYPVVPNKFDLYAAAQWCDVSVPDGSGGFRPRFTFNGSFSEERMGREAIEYICGIFGGRYFDDGNGYATIKLDIDAPARTLFTRENVVDGIFNYSYTEISTRFNDVTVKFINPDMDWKVDSRRVFDQAHIDYYGRIPTSMIAIGCTSAAEAIARARYKLVTGTTEKTIVSFKTNRHGTALQPYHIILVSDPDMMTGLTGRITSYSTNRVELRDSIYLEPGLSYFANFTTVNPVTGELEVLRRAILSADSGTRTWFRVSGGDLPTLPEFCAFAIEEATLAGIPKAYRVLSVTEAANNPDLVDITATEVNRTKWSDIEGTAPANTATSAASYSQNFIDSPNNLAVAAATVLKGATLVPQLLISWDASPNPFAKKYRVYEEINGGQRRLITETISLNYLYQEPVIADYVFSVSAVGLNGTESKAISITHHLVGSGGNVIPANTVRLVDGKTATEFESLSPRFAWNLTQDVSFKEYEIQIINPTGGAVLRTVTQPGAEYIYPYQTHLTDNGGTPLRSLRVSVKTVNQFGVKGDPITLTVTNSAPAAPTGLTTNVSVPNQIIVNFNKPTELDWVGSEVHVGGSAGFTPGVGTLVYDGANTNLSIARSAGTVYVKVGHYDSYSKTGMIFSSAATAIVVDPPVDDLIPPATPTGLALASTGTFDGSGTFIAILTASWSANAEPDFKSYDLEIQESGRGWSTFMTTQLNHEMVVKPGVTYNARILARDIMDNKSGYSSTVSIAAATDTTAPGVGTSLTAQSMLQSVFLTWNNPTSIDYDHTDIYQASVNNFASATLVGSVSGTFFSHENLPNDATRYYWIKSVDKAGNASATHPTSATGGVVGTTKRLVIDDLDRTAPAVPTALALSQTTLTTSAGVTLTRMKATWTAPADTDLAFYQVAIAENGGGEVVSTAATNSFDWVAIPGRNYVVRVLAVDFAQNKSSYTTTQNLTASGDAVAPATPTGLTATANFESIWLSWARNTEADLAGYEIYQLGTPTPAPVAGTTASFFTPASQAVIGNLSPSVIRYYWLRAVDTSGNKSAWTSAVSGTPLLIQNADIAAGAINASNFAAGLTPVEILAALPNTGNFVGRQVFLTTDSKLYRHTGSPTDSTGYTKTVDGGDLVANSITTGAISAGAINTAQLAAGAVRANNLAVGDFTNQIDNWDFALGDTAWDKGLDWSIINSPANASRGNWTSRRIANVTPSSLSMNRPVPVLVGDDWYAECMIRKGGVGTGGANVRIVALDAAGAVVTTIDGNSVTATTSTKSSATYKVVSGVTAIRVDCYAENSVGIVYADEFRILRVSGSVLIANGAVTADKVTTGELITLAAQIKNATIVSAHINELSAAVLTAGTALAGSITVDNRALHNIASDTIFDDFGSGRLPLHLGGTAPTFTIVSDSTAPTGSNAVEISGGAAARWGIADLIPFEPSKLYRIRFRLKRVSGTLGNFFLGVIGYAADGVTRVSSTGADTITGHPFFAASAVAQSTISTSVWTDYVCYIKGSAATGTTALATTADAPGQMHTSVRHIRPHGVTNHTTGDCVIRLDSVTVEVLTDEAAAVINGGSTQILPGKILISGATSLSDWRNGSDNTKIEGGSIAANTVTTNKLTVGLRNIKVEGLEFEHNSPTTNSVSWTGGAGVNIRYFNDADVLTTANIPTGSNAAWTSGSLYIYWVQGATAISTTTTAATAFDSNNVVLAIYRGGTDLVTDLGRTIIDGGKIKTDTITANQITANAITTAKINAGAIVASKMALINTSNLVLDEQLQDNNYWNWSSGWNIVTDAAAIVEAALNSAKVAKTPTGNGTTSQTATNFMQLPANYIPVEAGMKYLISARLMHIAGFTGRLSFNIQFFKGDKTSAGSATIPAGNQGTDYRTTAAAVDTLQTISTELTIPTNARYVRWRVELNWSTTQNNASFAYLAWPTLTRKSGAELLVDGSIISNHIASRTIQADRIAAGVLTANEIAANTISADKLQIGMRGIKIEGIEFEHNSPATNRVSWSAGTITYRDNTGALVTAAISAGNNATPWSSGTLYFYWVQGATTLAVPTTTAATAFATNNVVLATYRGGTDLVVDFGRTVIDGSKIKTGTVIADRLSVTSLSSITANVGTLTSGLIRSGASGLEIDLTNNRIRSNNFDAAALTGYQLDGATGTLTANNVIIAGGTAASRPFELSMGFIQDRVSSDEGVIPVDIAVEHWNEELIVRGSVKRHPASVEFDMFYSWAGYSKTEKINVPRVADMPWVHHTAYVTWIDENTGTGVWYRRPIYIVFDFTGKIYVSAYKVSTGALYSEIGDLGSTLDDPMSEDTYTNTDIIRFLVPKLYIRRVPLTVLASGVPTPPTKVRVLSWGAGGMGLDDPGDTSFGGPGGFLKADIPVTPGTMLTLLPGGHNGIGFGAFANNASSQYTDFNPLYAGGGSFVFLGKRARSNILSCAGGGGSAGQLLLNDSNLHDNPSRNGGAGGSATSGGNGSSSTKMDRCVGVSTPLVGRSGAGGGGYEGGGQISALNDKPGRGGTNYVIGTATNVTNSGSAEDGDGCATTQTPPGTGEANYTTYCPTAGQAGNTGAILLQWLTS